jgi:hypothetical protein
VICFSALEQRPPADADNTGEHLTRAMEQAMTQANKEELIAARDITADMPDLRVAEVQRIYLNLNPTGQLSQPGQITSCLEWAVVSDTGQKPLTEAQASKILAAYQAMKLLLKGGWHPDR